jgi:hypothetical protein
VRFLDDAAGLAARMPGAQTDAPPLSLSWTLACYILLLCALAHGHFAEPARPKIGCNATFKSWRLAAGASRGTISSTQRATVWSGGIAAGAGGAARGDRRVSSSRWR